MPVQGTVLFLQGSGERGGAESELLALLHALPGAGWRAVVAALAEGPFLEEIGAVPGTDVVVLPRVPRLRRPAGILRAVARVDDTIRACGAHVVQGAGEKMTLLAAMAGRRAGVPSVGWLHDAPASWREPAAFAVQTLLRTASPSSVVVVADWMARELLRLHHLPSTVIHNGLDMRSVPEGGAGRAALLSATGFPADAVIAMHIGRLQRWKGADVALRALRLAADESLYLAVVGGSLYGREPGWAGELEALSRSLGITDRVRFLGHRDDARMLASGADVVVHSSRKPEPFGMVVVEAMAMSRCVIASRTRGPEEIIEDGRTGLLVDPDDPAALAAALRRTTDPAIRRQLSEAARHASAARFHIDGTAQAFAAEWRRLSGRVLA